MRSSVGDNGKPGHVTKGDVFDDLGLSRAETVEAKVKSDLWRELMAYVTPLGLTQRELAKRLGVHQPEVSHLLNGKLSKFSAGTLIQYAVKLDCEVQVRLTAPADPLGQSASRSRRKGCVASTAVEPAAVSRFVGGASDAC